MVVFLGLVVLFCRPTRDAVLEWDGGLSFLVLSTA